MLIVSITFGIGIIICAVFTSLCCRYLENPLAAATGINMKFLTDSIEHNLDDIRDGISFFAEKDIIGKYTRMEEISPSEYINKL